MVYLHYPRRKTAFSDAAAARAFKPINSIQLWRAMADVVVPGSKSITNRALICATLAEGVSRLTGVLDADDTQAMLGVVEAVGPGVEQFKPGDRVLINWLPACNR